MKSLFLVSVLVSLISFVTPVRADDLSLKPTLTLIPPPKNITDLYYSFYRISDYQPVRSMWTRMGDGLVNVTVRGDAVESVAIAVDKDSPFQFAKRIASFDPNMPFDLWMVFLPNGSSYSVDANKWLKFAMMESGKGPFGKM